MAKYRNALPQLGERIFVTDGGIETTLIFLDGLDLPLFAAFPLHDTPEGWAALKKYFTPYAALARDRGAGCVLETATWRANHDWGVKLGYSAEALERVNRDAVKLLLELRKEFETEASPLVISGCLGPRGDGYQPEAKMTAEEAQAYHDLQVRVFAETDADLVTAITMNYVEEAIGIARAARARNMPVVISFTVETDGRLPTGQSLQEAIEETDAATDGAPLYYMINCAHPEHFRDLLRDRPEWARRLQGIRANASTKSHAELNESTELDAGDPEALARDYVELKELLPALRVVGGCCGTDHRHITAIHSAVG
ncbi:MAG TPA: homocysteine S-methyltransferase family protein [Ferrovibrio sp.]|uniref:homocysteine S-methyltransferase family protein n=1 Tax=Ferrovibrio sp. TaxID=1917215 RepID=UPI002B4AFFAD|nr:homocysteine S-methyltransferase family protein [Ferrovibrio sp.]HLT75915.1 homocysteine S-methyltransferase family protein [Ferrovibrio sp.]